MPSNRRKQFNPTKSVHNIEPDDKAGPSSGNLEDTEVKYREVKLFRTRGVGYYIKNFVYVKTRECHGTGKIFLRCQHARPSCNARAYIKIRSKRAIITQSYHPHPPPNHKQIEFKTPLPTKKRSSPTKAKRTSPRKATPVKDGSKVGKEEDEDEAAKEKKGSPNKAKKDSPSSEEGDVKLLRERSQRVKKLPVRLREDPSPIPIMGKRKKKKKILVLAPPKKKKKTAPVEKKAQPVKFKLDVIHSDTSIVDSSDSSDTDSDGFGASDSSHRRSPSRSPRQRRSPRKGSPGSSGSSPKSKDTQSAMEVLRQLTDKMYADLENEPEDDEDDDFVVTSDDEEEEKRKPKKVADKKESKQRTILDVDQLRKLSATALVLKFSKHSTSKVPKDANTFTYQHQYACTMLPGICSEKFCGNAVDTKPQIKRHLLRHIGELLTMTNQVSPATAFPGSVQSQAKRRMPTTEEIEEIEDLDSPGGAGASKDGSDDDDDDTNASTSKDIKTEDDDDSKVKTVSYQIPSSHQPNKVVRVDLPKDVDVKRSSFTVIRSAEGVNEVVLLPKGRLINLSAMRRKSEETDEAVDEHRKEDKEENGEEQKEKEKKDEDQVEQQQEEDNEEEELQDAEDEKEEGEVEVDEEEEKDGEKETEEEEHEEEEEEHGEELSEIEEEDEEERSEMPEGTVDKTQTEDRKKKKPYYPNYKRKKGLSKTRAFYMRQSAVKLEIVDDFDEDIDIEDNSDTDSDNSLTMDDKIRKHRGSQENIETEEVSLAGAFKSPDVDSSFRHRSGDVPSTSQEIECDIVVRTRKHLANKKPGLPKAVGRSLKSGKRVRHAVLDEKFKNLVAADPPGDDHNYAWHPARYISGPTHTDSRGNQIDKPEEKEDMEEKFDLDPIFYPLQSGGSSSEKKSKHRRDRSVSKTIPGVGKVVKLASSKSVEASNPRWAKGTAREKRELTDEEKKMKKKALELLNSLHKKQAFKGHKGPFKCQLCGKNVTAAGTLRAHYRSHAGIKPYRCKLCQATFTRLHSLKYHMMIHNQQSRFVCDHCSREFRHASHFREHLRRHTGEEPFGCTDCPARFKTRNTYKRHLYAKHGKLLTADGIQLVPAT